MVVVLLFSVPALLKVLIGKESHNVGSFGGAVQLREKAAATFSSGQLLFGLALGRRLKDLPQHLLQTVLGASVFVSGAPPSAGSKGEARATAFQLNLPSRLRMMMRMGRCRMRFSCPAGVLLLGELMSLASMELSPRASSVSSTKLTSVLPLTTNMSTLGLLSASSSSLSDEVAEAVGLSSASLISAQSDVVRSRGTGKCPTKAIAVGNGVVDGVHVREGVVGIEAVHLPVSEAPAENVRHVNVGNGAVHRDDQLQQSDPVCWWWLVSVIVIMLGGIVLRIDKGRVLATDGRPREEVLRDGHAPLGKGELDGNQQLQRERRRLVR
ncbi:hypothetical protein TYRP_013796 [Tyrophagus putrescentiae]|nr:hypothetical protein TYRP_013796 [Tyrophagus putrescentiae]